jgi:DNA-K related protein/Hsp70 protein
VSDLPDGFQEQPSRYVVGIDLGTTNSAVGYIDTTEQKGKIRCFRVKQWVDLGVEEPRELLPSFHYQPMNEESTGLRNAKAIVGQFARDRGAQLPGRQIASAKSWLCHAGVDRNSPILPWQCDSGVEKLSPVAASGSYLARIREAWDKEFPTYPLAEQDIVLTLPASFDQVARHLTIEAAKLAGLQRIMPIEEPQAAFYAWLARHDSDWESKVSAGQTILVCDIGGGTTDFTLIRVRQSSAASVDKSIADANDQNTLNQLHQQRLTLHRVAVGQHLILGGDNIDLALARTAEAKLTGGKPLPPRSWDALLGVCRTAKETLLRQQASNELTKYDSEKAGAESSDADEQNSPKSYTIHLPGTGSRLIGGGNQVELTMEEVQRTVIDGFFPFCELSQRPEQQATGFQEFGLPYAKDAAVTHHLAAFLWDQRTAGRTDAELQSMDEQQLARPDWILFNGGVLTSQQIAGRIVDCVSKWFSADNAHAWRPGVLDGERLDLAVAFGAAYFGRVKRGFGVEIEAKLACSYYLQVSSDPPEAVCIVPGSASPGESFKLDQALQLTIGQPVQFPILYSSTRLADAVGKRIAVVAEEFSYLPPIRTVLDVAGRKRKELLPVELRIELSQIGTLQMWCQAIESQQRWKLEFDIRGSTQTDHLLQEATANRAGILDDTAEAAMRDVLLGCFDSKDGPIKTSKLMGELTQCLNLNRSQWPPQLLRAMWQALMELKHGKNHSAEHEARWLNLLGYSLRPGYGMAADDWRVAETWRHIHGKLNFNTPSSRNEAMILWRRIAGGFTPGQQLTVYQQIAGPLRQVLDPSKRNKSGANPAELIELLRLAGSLELLSKLDKTQLGSWAIDLLKSSKYQACHGAICWCVGRLGARQPAYGPLNCVIDTADVTRWIERLLDLGLEDPNYNLGLMSCSRRVGDRYRDISDELRQRVLNRLEQRAASSHYLHLVREGGDLAGEEASDILGDSLPLGLQLRGV